MELTAFHKLRAAVQQNAFPGTGLPLLDAEVALRETLLASELFVRVEAERTDDPDRLLIALCQFRPDLTEWEVAMRLEQLWAQRVAYPFWEVHTLIVEDGHVELEAASRESAHSHYVTVHFVAQRARVPHQRAPHEQD